MQSEAGAIAAVHGALQTGALSTSFTSSQGLLLMIPTLYKLAGQLTPFVLHVAARTVATHALSIFGDHSDVMAVRQTGCAMLCASSVQEAQDFALISHIATLKSRVPFIHFFDGFRTSHEINKIVPLADDTLLSLVPQADIDAHRARALNPEHPVIRGTSANPDTYFQSREATNPWYNAVYNHVEQAMNDFAAATGREYKPFEYYGHPQAERVIVLMGSAIGTCEEVVDELLTRGEKVGVLKVRLFRPFSAKHLLSALPESARSVAVLDRTKEPGAHAEPLYLDVMTALAEAFSNGERETLPRVIGGRYGLSSKEFGPDCVLAVFNELSETKPKPRFTVGIYDDVTHLSLALPENTLPSSAKLEALFYGLGSDGSVSATKNNIKIIGNSTPWYAQGYFVYDSKKAGGLTVSHLRVSEHPICPRISFRRLILSAVTSCSLSINTRWPNVSNLAVFSCSTRRTVRMRSGRACRRKCRRCLIRKERVFCHQRSEDCPRMWSCRAHQHRHADGVLPPDKHSAGRQRLNGTAGRDRQKLQQ